MLVLTRVVNQLNKNSIIITDSENNEIIEIMLLGISGSQVKVGIEASDKYKIFRKELLNKDIKGEE